MSARWAPMRSVGAAPAEPAANRPAASAAPSRMLVNRLIRYLLSGRKQKWNRGTKKPSHDMEGTNPESSSEMESGKALRRYEQRNRLVRHHLFWVGTFLFWHVSGEKTKPKKNPGRVERPGDRLYQTSGRKTFPSSGPPCNSFPSRPCGGSNRQSTWSL